MGLFFVNNFFLHFFDSEHIGSLRKTLMPRKSDKVTKILFEFLWLKPQV